MFSTTRYITLFLVALLVLYFLCLDTMAKPLFESQATEMYGAEVSVDRVAIDTQGLVQASAALAVSIERLAVSIERLASDSAALSDEDKALMMSAVQSVDAAGRALGQLAQEMPRAAQDFGERLPQAIRDSGQPIA